MLQNDVVAEPTTARPASSLAPELRPAPGETVAGTVRRMAGVQKGAQGAPAYGRFVNRPLGRVLAAVAFHRGLTPDAVTATSAVFTFSGIAAIALAPHTWWIGLLVAAALVLGYALDSADGQLARLRGGGSPAGEWLDHMVDAAKVACLHLAVLVGLYRNDVDEVWLLVPLAYVVVDVVYFFAMLLNEALRERHGAATRASSSGQRPSVLRALVLLPTDYGAECLVFLLLGSATAFLVGYGVLLACTVGFLVLALPRWRAEMAQLGAGPAAG